MGEIIKLREAVMLVWETVKTTMEQDVAECPYVFIVGSGISAPEILTAGGIIEHCRERVKTLYGEGSEEWKRVLGDSENLRENSAGYYSFWFGQAYKNKKNRQQYLRGLIDNARISTSNLLLAQILNNKKIATTVITPNFDNHLLKSLNLLGNYNVFSANNVLDNIALDKGSDTIQIMHVHGTYEFYDCCNLENEIIKIASEQGIKTTAGTIEEFLKPQSPIVIGYSGWEDDVIMSKMRERIEYAALPYKWLWFCYSRQDYENLPDWLKNTEDVVFILPDLKEDPEEKVDGEHEESVLPAEDVLSALIAKFGFEAPHLFSNPIQYYIELIDGFLPENTDMFPTKTWKRRLDDIEKHLSQIDRQIISLDAAAARKDIVDITPILKEINDGFLLIDDLQHVLKGVLLPLLNSKNRIEDTADLLQFLGVILDLLEKKAKDLGKEDLDIYLNRVIKLALSYKRKIEDEDIIEICDRIMEIYRRRGYCERMYLAVLGTKSDFVDAQQRIAIRNEIIEYGKRELENKEIARLVLIAALKQIKDQGDISGYYNEVMYSVKEKHEESEEISELYYRALTELLSRRIELSISKKDLLARIKESELSPALLLRAYKVCCDVEQDTRSRVRLAMDAVEEHDIETIKFRDEIRDYTFLIGYVVLGKIDLGEKVEPKYIDYGIDLCHKEESYPVISGIIVNTLEHYFDTIESQYEKRELYKKAIDICERDQLDEEWVRCNNAYFECMEKKEQEDYLKRNERYRIYRESWEKMSMAVDAYVRHDIDLCRNLLLEASKVCDEIFEERYNPVLINLCFMARRGEVPEMEIPALDLMNKITWLDNDAYLHINKALIYVAEQSWEKARTEVRKIKYSLKGAIQWWEQEEVVGKEEKAIVFVLLVLENQINMDAGLTELLDFAVANIYMPDDMKQEICLRLEPLADKVKK